MKCYSDTDQKFEKLQLDLMRRASTAKKISCMRSLSSAVRELSYRAVKRAHPELSERELDVFFVSIHYGKNLADRLKAYLENNNPEKPPQ